jgi:hypothetical protein
VSRPRLAAVLAPIALLASLALLALLAPIVRVPAAGATAPCSGVMVVVDFGHWNRDVDMRCVNGNPSSGLDALDDAGFDPRGTLQFGAAYVCRIGGFPTEGEQACVVTPPANAYWAYYWARPGDASWHYSDTGAAGRTPPAGTIDAWAFGDNAMPRVSPAAFPRPAPPATHPPIGQSSAAAGQPVAPASGGGGVTPAPSVPGATAPRSSPTTAHGTVATADVPPTTVRRVGAARSSRSTTTTTLVPIVDRAAAPIRADNDSGSPWPVFLALALLAALGTGAFFIIRARRQAKT